MTNAEGCLEGKETRSDGAVRRCGLFLEDRQLIECGLPAMSVQEDTGEPFFDDPGHRLAPMLRFVVGSARDLTIKRRRIVSRSAPGVLLLDDAG